MRRYCYPAGYCCGCPETWFYDRNTLTLEFRTHQCSIWKFVIIYIYIYIYICIYIYIYTYNIIYLLYLLSNIFYFVREYGLFQGSYWFASKIWSVIGKIVLLIRKLVMCLENRIFVRKYDFQSNLIICFENMTFLFKGVTSSETHRPVLFGRLSMGPPCGSLVQRAWGGLGPNISAPGPKAPRACQNTSSVCVFEGSLSEVVLLWGCFSAVLCKTSFEL